MLSRSFLMILVLVFVCACGDDSPSVAPVPAVEASESAPSEVSALEPPPSAPEPLEGPPIVTSLDTLLPDPPQPVSLQNARALAARGAWPQAAAVYDGLLEGSPSNARYLAGRGYALVSWDDPRALPFARSDLEQALVGANDPLGSSTHYNLGRLEERAGDVPAALAHYQQAFQLRQGRAARAAIERLGGSPAPIPTCTFNPSAQAPRFDSLLAVYQAIVDRGLRDGWRAPNDPPENEDDAGYVLGGDGSEPFGTTFEYTSDIVSAHLVVPANPGYYLVAGIVFGSEGRCGDSSSIDGVHTEAGLVRAHIELSVGHWYECDESDGSDCGSGCGSDLIEAVDVFLNPSTGRYISLTRTTDETSGTTESFPAVRVIEGRVTARGCQSVALP